MKRAAVAELKRTAAAEVKVEAKRAAAAAAEVEDTDEQGYFERISTFQGRNAEFVQTAASAVGAEGNGHWPALGGPTPDGGWEAKVVRMLKQGFYPNGLVEFQEDQYSPLHHAVIYNHQTMCQILLTAGADANLSCTFGDVCYPPLHDVQSEDVCALLLDVVDPSVKADVNALAMGCTALMVAAARGKEGIAFMLLAAGADPTIYATYSTEPRIFEGAGEGSLAGETAAKTARRCGHLTLAGMLDDAERSHPKPWVEPASEGPGPGDPGYTEYAVEQIRENRASLERRMKEYSYLPA